MGLLIGVYDLDQWHSDHEDFMCNWQISHISDFYMIASYHATLYLSLQTRDMCLFLEGDVKCGF